MNVLEFYGINPAEGTFGVEVEVEGGNLPVVDNNVWTTTHDGSLRGESAEYIFRKPLPFHKVELALTTLKNSFQKKGSQLKFSYRTSVHVHVNVQQFNRMQLGNLIYLYMLFEEPLIRFCGKSRVGNRFCLRIRDAEAFLPYVTSAFEDREFPILEQNEVRYLGMNLGALAKFGSVEFRSMRGTMDIDVLMKWVGMLDKMRTFALKEEMTPALIANHPDIFSAVFGDLGVDLEYPGMDMDMRASFSRTLEFPFDIEWVRKKEMNKVEANPHHLKKLANDQRGVRPPVVNQADRIGRIQGFAEAQRNAQRIPDEIQRGINPAQVLVADPLDWMAFQEGQ